MRIDHKICPEGEEFVPEYSECVATSYLKTTKRRKSMINPCEKEEQCDKGKKKPVSCPEPPEENDDEPEPANEWVDLSKGTGRKVPNEFKPKPKTRLRIYHLHCKRKPKKRSHVDKGEFLAKISRVRRSKNLEKIPRSYVIRVNKKNQGDEELKSDDNDDDEEDDEEEVEEEDDEEDNETEKQKNDNKEANKETKKEGSKNPQTGFVKRIQKPGATLYVNGPKTDKTGVSTKIILDADVRLNSAFGDALQKILKDRKLSKKGAGDNVRNGKAEAMRRRRNENVEAMRRRRNFFRSWFMKKKTAKEKEKNSEKEALVNLDHIINGVTSEFEREALLQKLEQKKNKAAKIQRSDWRDKKSTENRRRRKS